MTNTDNSLENIVEVSQTHLTRMGITLTKMTTVYSKLTGLLIKYPELRHPEMVSACIELGNTFQENVEAESAVCNDLCAMLIYALTPISNPSQL